MVDVKGETWTADEEYKAKGSAARLLSYTRINEAKYQRNYGRYQNNGLGAAPSLFSFRSDVAPAYNTYAQRSPSAGIQTSINVLKSSVDTVVSKMSQARVRPFFGAVRGTYQTIKACRAGQEFFDGFFERENVYILASEALRDACIFDKGILFIDEDTERVTRAEPWTVGVDPAEWGYAGARGLTRCALQQDEFPLRTLENLYGKQPKIYSDRENQETAGQLIIYWDLLAGKKWYFFEGNTFRVVKIDYKRAPFVWIYWNQPLKGYNSTSLVDENYTLQVDIDELNKRIDDATRNGIFNMVWVPKGSEVKASAITNQGASVNEYNPGATGAGVTVATPPAINQQWIELLRLRIAQAYENAGISQLSAQSKKPAGADSGRALQTLADMESERFNVTLQSYLRLFIDLAGACIDIFPKNAEVVKTSYEERSAKWGDVKGQRDSYNIQFSAGSALSKDPTRRLAEIDMMVQRGMIPKEQAASLMQIPDLEGAYSTATAAYDYTQVVIERCIEDGIVQYEPVTNLNLLFSEAMRWLLRLSADEANEKYRKNLARLIEDVQKQLEKVELPMETPAPKTPSPAVVPGIGPGPAPAQAGTPMGV